MKEAADRATARFATATGPRPAVGGVLAGTPADTRRHRRVGRTGSIPIVLGRESNRPMIRRLVAGIAMLTVAAAGCRGRDRDSAQSGATTTVVGATASAGIAAQASGGAATVASGAFLDPNAATREQLLAIPAINATTADALVAGRPYENMVAVDRVLARGNVSEQQRDTVYTRLWKPIDLNTASKEEILLIPGVGPRMQHEFEEYRPYRSIGQFRREIGKYVSPQEVARLERYVTIRGQ
jgi:DNA uptake protein ComE-like DNA-binding protein